VRLASALALVFVLVALLATFGPPLPGPSLGELLGIADDSPTQPCTPDARHTRIPSGRASSPGRWREEPPSPLSRSEIKAAVADGGVYLIGGQGTGGRSVGSVIRFDPRTGRYTQVAKLPSRLDHAGVAARGSNVYVVGGYVDSRPTGAAWRFSLETRRWTALPSLRAPRGGLGAAAIGDRIYAAGGAPTTFPNYYAKPYGTLEVLDLKTSRWTFARDMPTPRHHVAAAALGGKLYVIGGRSPTDFSLPTAERYDPSHDRWERLAPLPQGVGGAEAAVTGGRLVVTGGGDEEGLADGRGWVTPAVWSLRPDDASWRRMPDLSSARHGHASASFGGRVYVFEGAPCPGYGRQRSVESLKVR
jgi:Kelch motif